MRVQALAGAIVLAVAGSLGGCGSSPSDTAKRPSLSQVAVGPVAPKHRRGLAPLAPRTPQPGPKVTTPVPVLMYHVIATAPPGTAYPELWVAPPLFKAQVRALKAHGYEAVTLQRVWDAWHGRDTLPAHPVVLSFDDGYLSQYTHAAKTLRPLG